jgi:hypothetical protein
VHATIDVADLHDDSSTEPLEGRDERWMLCRVTTARRRGAARRRPSSAAA